MTRQVAMNKTPDRMITPRPGVPSPPPLNRRGGSLPPSLLLLLLLTSLTGCIKKEDFVRLGIIVAPVCVFLMTLLLYGIGKRYRVFAADPYLRPWIMILPTLILLFSDLLLWFNLTTTQQNVNVLTEMLVAIGPITALLMMPGLQVLTLVIWRIWLIFSPRTSYEGASLLAPVLYFGPGVLYAHGIFAGNLFPLLGWLVIYNFYSFFALPVIPILFWFEVWYRGRAQKPLAL